MDRSGQLRPIIIDKGGPTTRGMKPRYGEVKKVKKIQGADVIDENNKVYSTKFTLPVSETTEDAGPVRIEQPGSEVVDRTRRERLQQYANELVRFLRRTGGLRLQQWPQSISGEMCCSRWR